MKTALEFLKDRLESWKRSRFYGNVQADMPPPGTTEEYDRFLGDMQRIVNRAEFNNPAPVVIGIVPINGYRHVLGIERRTPEGGIALPGGYIDAHETPEQAVAREIKEETGLELDKDLFELETAIGHPKKNLVIMFYAYFGRLPVVTDPKKLFTDFEPNDEVVRLVEITPRTELCFPIHNQGLDWYLGAT